jgi:hypothetical protein
MDSLCYNYSFHVCSFSAARSKSNEELKLLLDNPQKLINIKPQIQHSRY